MKSLGIGAAATQLPADGANGFHDENVVVDAHAEDQKSEADDLEPVEALPSDDQREAPNHHRANRVENLRRFESKFSENSENLRDVFTIRVVAEISLVTLIPAKLKNAMLTMVPEMGMRSR